MTAFFIYLILPISPFASFKPGVSIKIKVLLLYLVFIILYIIVQALPLYPTSHSFVLVIALMKLLFFFFFSPN